mmetsp:Transcript_57562/g.171648  ORF Transcript_57562/g.171648 Transcript_57562/m.171648 type:complete len:101 (-) Transcript_57562:979-1281(-)
MKPGHIQVDKSCVDHTIKCMSENQILMHRKRESLKIKLSCCCLHSFVERQKSFLKIILCFFLHYLMLVAPAYHAKVTNSIIVFYDYLETSLVSFYRKARN